MRQIEHEQVSENVSGLAEWAQVRAKTMRKRKQFNEQPFSPTKSSFNRGPVQTQSKPQRYQIMITATSSASLPVECALCERDHSEVKCPTFFAATIDKRWDIVKARKVCFGCLKHGHQRRQLSRCGVSSCGKGHHYLLHATEPKEGLKPQEPQIVELPTENKGVGCNKAQGSLTGSSKVALKIVTVPFVSNLGKIIMGLVLLDTGSETTLIRTEFAAQLGVQGPKQNLSVDAVIGVTTTVKSQRVRLPFAPSVTKANVNAWTMTVATNSQLAAGTLWKPLIMVACEYSRLSFAPVTDVSLHVSHVVAEVNERRLYSQAMIMATRAKMVC